MWVWQIILFLLTIRKLDGIGTGSINTLKYRYKANFTIESPRKKTLQSDSINQQDSYASLPTETQILSTTGLMSEITVNNVSLESHILDNVPSLVGTMSWQALRRKIRACHCVLLTLNSMRPLLHNVISYAFLSLEPLVIVDLRSLEQDSDLKHLATHLWGGSSTSCRTLFIDVVDVEEDLFSFLESSRLWMWAHVRVVLVGRREKADFVLQNSALRNVPQPLYLGFEDEVIEKLIPSPPVSVRQIIQTRLNSRSMESTYDFSLAGSSSQAFVYARCLYCDDGEPETRFISFWRLGSHQMPPIFDPFPDQENNMQGHLLRIVAMRLFPYSDYDLDKDEPGSTITHRDCLDKRMLATFSSKLNFSLELRAPWDGSWGLPKANGNWTGMVGTVQHGKADFTTMIALNPARIAIIDFARVYDTDVLALVSLKPQVLPRYLLIIRPFTGDVWLYLLLSIMIWGTAFWLLRKMWSGFSGETGITINEAIFHSWAVILEDPPRKPMKNSAEQIIVGWWLIGCLVITTVFKSGLVANLAVESKSAPIDSMDDMVKIPNWKWGTFKVHLTGSPKAYFTGNPDPVVQTVNRYLEPIDNASVGLAKALKGSYTYLEFKNGITTEIASYHTDQNGWSPFYVSKYGNKILSDFGWGLRKGAPFGGRIKVLMDRLIEVGIIYHWTEVVMKSRVEINRKQLKRSHSGEGIKQDDDATVLRMSHMMGVFLILLLSFGLSFLVFLGEKFLFFPKHQES